MSERPINLRITGQIKGFQIALSLETAKESLKNDTQFLIGLIEEVGALPFKTEEKILLTEGPLERLEKELNVDKSTLRSIIGYKEGMVQIARASQLQVADAMCMLLFAYEKGFNESAIAFDQFDSLVKQNGIKLTYPLTTGIFNLKKGGYINAKLYDEEKQISLSPKGDEKAISAFKDYIAGKEAKRTPRVSKKIRNAKKRQVYHEK